MATFYTIGHSNRSIEGFIALLKEAKIARAEREQGQRYRRGQGKASPSSKRSFEASPQQAN